MPTSDTRSQQDLERFSKLLFGSALRLAIGAYVARAEPAIVSVVSVVEDLGLAAERYSAARKELESFADAGLLVRLPKPKGERIQRYERTTNEYWRAVALVFDEQSGNSSGG
jgi:hypothetical protein